MGACDSPECLVGFSLHNSNMWLDFGKLTKLSHLGLFRFIGPANGYTCALHIHSAFIRLVDWSAFLEQVLLTLWIRNWDIGSNGGHYIEGMGLKFTPVIGRSLLGHSSMFRHFWDPYLVQTVLTEGLTHIRIPTYPLYLLLPLPPAHPL